MAADAPGNDLDGTKYDWSAIVAAALRLLPPGAGRTHLAARFLRRRPFQTHTLRRCRLRDGTIMELDLGIDQESRAYLVGDWEPATVRFIVRGRPRVVLDVGANVGLIALPVARRLHDSRVFAFEPHPENILRLEQNVSLNALTNVEIVRAAAGSVRGTVSMAERSPMMHHIVPSGDLDVPCVSLDGFCAERALRVDLIKIDVEGHELEVLRGALSLLRDQRPTIVCELNDLHLRRAGASAAEVRTLLNKLGYRESPLPPVGLQRLRIKTWNENVVFEHSARAERAHRPDARRPRLSDVVGRRRKRAPL